MLLNSFGSTTAHQTQLKFVTMRLTYVPLGVVVLMVGVIGTGLLAIWGVCQVTAVDGPVKLASLPVLLMFSIN